MRYILDDNGYIDSVSCTPFECKNKGCQEYTGTVPTGYNSLVEWVTTANIRTYKIVEGNLVYDEAREAELENELKKCNVLWEGAELLGASQIINLSSTPISSQPNGIVLVFSAYENNAPKEYDYKTVFIPKKIVELKSGVGHDFWFNTASFGYVGAKYIYFSDTEIKGHANNTSTGTGSTGIKYTNNHWCLRYVIGV